VIGMPDPVLGERVCVYVAVRENCAVPTLEQLAGHMKAIGLAKFKWPERVEVIDTLPLTRIGKVDKAKLREDLRQRLAETTTVEATRVEAGSRLASHVNVTSTVGGEPVRA
jgi:non-ribosomal peptide synthetase component E (peptide arylation enzyme)